MNQKTAKRLRKIAYGMVLTAEQSKPDTKISRVAYKRAKNSATITVAPNTWKGAYKALKKAVKNNEPVTV